MDLSILLGDLFAPAMLFFIIGMLTVFIKSDLEIPPEITKAAAIFLLISIGIEGGAEAVYALQKEAGLLTVILATAGIAIVVATISVVFNATIFSKIGFSTADAWATAGVYGAVSSATLVAAVGVAEAAAKAVPGELIYVGWMPAANVFLDAAGVIAAIFLGRMALARESRAKQAISIDKKGLFHEALVGYAIWLMLAGVIVGVLSSIFSPDRLDSANAFFDEMFAGILCIYLIDMGMLAARRLGELKALGSRLVLAIVAAFGLPQIWAGAAMLGMYGLHLAFPGMVGWGDAFVFAAMAGSASYISAPPALRAAIPEANPSTYLPMALALTFPFNLLVSFPLWKMMAQALWGAL